MEAGTPAFDFSLINKDEVWGRGWSGLTHTRHRSGNTAATAIKVAIENKITDYKTGATTEGEASITCPESSPTAFAPARRSGVRSCVW